MWRVTGVFLFMCGALAMHLWQQDWSVLRLVWEDETVPQVASVHTYSSIQTAEATTTRERPTIDALLEDMSLEEKIGQMLMIGHWSDSNYMQTSALVREYQLGGIIIMSIKDSDIEDVSTWTKAWQRANTIPLLISIDQEGGSVSRIRADGYTQTSQRELTSPQKAYQTGLKRGRELAELGINTNLAPVLDYASTSDSFLFERSFASSSQLGALASALISGHNEAGVLAIPKHFPGHDDTPTDSHKELPTVSITAAEFPEYVRQFREVLKENHIGAMMTAHVLFPKLDDVYPTTLSEEILSRQLRRELDFDGVIITDDMTMGAITNTWSSNEAAVRAVEAGADMILFAAEPDASVGAREALLSAVASGDLEEERIDASVRRILTLKDAQGLSPFGDSP